MWYIPDLRGIGLSGKEQSAAAGDISFSQLTDLQGAPAVNLCFELTVGWAWSRFPWAANK